MVQLTDSNSKEIQAWAPKRAMMKSFAGAYSLMNGAQQVALSMREFCCLPMERMQAAKEEDGTSRYQASLVLPAQKVPECNFIITLDRDISS